MPLLAAVEAVMSALRGCSVRKSKRSNGGVNTRSLYLCFFDHVIFHNTSEHSFLEGRRLPPEHYPPMSPTWCSLSNPPASRGREDWSRCCCPHPRASTSCSRPFYRCGVSSSPGSTPWRQWLDLSGAVRSEGRRREQRAQGQHLHFRLVYMVVQRETRLVACVCGEIKKPRFHGTKYISPPPPLRGQDLLERPPSWLC